MNVALIFQSRARSKRSLIGLSLSLIPGEPRIMKTNGRKQRRSYFKSGIWERECHLSHTCTTLQHAFFFDSLFKVLSDLYFAPVTRPIAYPQSHPPILPLSTRIRMYPGEWNRLHIFSMVQLPQVASHVMIRMPPLANLQDPQLRRPLRPG